MGNCTSGIKKKRKGDFAPENENNTDKPKEEVTYASIDHKNIKGSRKAGDNNDDDCDYATVNVPGVVQLDSESSSKEERDDDYVLMG